MRSDLSAGQPRPTARRLAPLVCALALGASAVLGACSAKAPDRAELIDALTTSGLTKSESTCAADAIFDSLTTDQIAQIVERGDSGAPRDDTTKTDDPLDKVRAALLVCRTKAEGSATTTTTPGLDPATGAPLPSSTTVPFGPEDTSASLDPADPTSTTVDVAPSTPPADGSSTTATP